MIPAGIKEAIFESIPVILDGTGVVVGYADRCDAALELQTSPLVATVRYYGNKTDKSRTPVNHIIDVQKENGEITYTMGEFQQVALSLNVYAVDYGELLAGDLLDGYIQLLQVWALRDLPAIVEVAGIKEMSDISDFNDALTRNFEIIIRTALTYERTAPAVGSIETDISL